MRRRGQGKTNIWIITRIPRNKLEQYIEDWRPNLTVWKRGRKHPQNPQTSASQNPQTKTSQDSQIKSPQNPQAEEQEPEEDVDGPQGRRTRPGNRSPSTGNKASITASETMRIETQSVLAGAVENSDESTQELSTPVETVEKLAAVAAEQFGVPDQESAIAHYLRQYDTHVARSALTTVLARIRSGEDIRKPIAYFYTVVRVAQAEHDAAEAEQQRDDSERRVIAVSGRKSHARVATSPGQGHPHRHLSLTGVR